MNEIELRIDYMSLRINKLEQFSDPDDTQNFSFFYCLQNNTFEISPGSPPKYLKNTYIIIFCSTFVPGQWSLSAILLFKE